MPGNKQTELHVLFISAEADPFVKIGGLGDVAGSLPPALQQTYKENYPNTNLDIRLVLPFYGVIQKQNLEVKQLVSFTINTKVGDINAEVFEYRKNGLTIYFISGDPIHPEDPVYGKNFVADAEKFLFFSLACLKLPKILDWHVDILHAQDWHTAIAIHQLKELKKKDRFYKNTRSVITIHNLPFMGTGSEKAIQKYKIQPSNDATLPEWGKTLPLPMGVSAADAAVAVSPTYAKEILTKQFSCNLDQFFKANLNKLSGILNGLDLDTWNPETDCCLVRNFTFATIGSRSENKLNLQRELKLEENVNLPLLISIGRMDPQKGIDMMLAALSKMLHIPWQIIILGSGDPLLTQSCIEFAEQNPERVQFVNTYSPELSHRMYSAGDMILMPSRYEPCGLAQMIAMRYGCIPVARATGGLRDTIKNHSSSKNGTGFLYKPMSADALIHSLTNAISWYHQQSNWQNIQKRAMNMDFSWMKSAKEYANLYNRLININQ